MRSFYLADNIITEQEREGVLGFLHSASNYYRNGRGRFWPASVGSFLACDISLDEAAAWLTPVIDRVNQSTNQEWEPRVSSILEYRYNNYIPSHLDSSSDGQGTSHTLIIPLNAPDQYAGGAMNIDNRRVVVPLGSGVIYGHNVLHSVEPIQRGVRYAWIVRLRKHK